TAGRTPYAAVRTGNGSRFCGHALKKVERNFKALTTRMPNRHLLSLNRWWWVRSIPSLVNFTTH
ncbi:MAG: hypothetical protein QOJ20_6139, partial [Mycobacterium sp.]|nr:hypothetical protein [Mycobacterium sp.]